MIGSIALRFGLLLTAGVAQAQPSPYAGQGGRAIKALSPQEVTDLMAGRGMGLAKAAELNSYPGPMHALELGDEIALTADQRAAIEASRGRMAEAARRLGPEIVSEEQALDRAFANARITPEELAARTDRLGRLQARLRAVHLQAHIETRSVLSGEQVAHYDRLRGYRAADDGAAQPPSRHGHGPDHRPPVPSTDRRG